MPTEQEVNPRIRRARVDSLDLYEITEDELTTLEHGSPGSLFLVFSIFLLSTALSFLVALLTTKIESIYTFTIFVVITALGFIIGLVLLGLWYRENRSSSSVSKKIRNRMKNEALNEDKKEETTDPNSTVG